MTKVEYYFYETFNVDAMIPTDTLHSLGESGWILCAVEVMDKSRRYTFANVVVEDDVVEDDVKITLFDREPNAEEMDEYQSLSESGKLRPGNPEFGDFLSRYLSNDQ